MLFRLNLGELQIGGGWEALFLKAFPPYASIGLIAFSLVPAFLK
jgi:hypothetical protein